MIVFKFYIGMLFLIFSSQIIVKKYFSNDHYAITLVKSFIAIFSFIWIFFLVTYYIGISHKVLQSIVFIGILFSIYELTKQPIFFIFIVKNFLFASILLFPLWSYFGEIFTEWDALVSWNRWAIDIYNNNYKPEGTAYPVLLSSLLGFIYKMQGSDQIWWTAKMSLFIIPLFVTMILINFYKETKNNFFIIVFFLSYTYMINAAVVSGYVDFPVALFGLLILILLYIPKATNNFAFFDSYLILAFSIAGISVVLKQSGIVFYIFSVVYAVLNYKSIKNKKVVLFYFILSAIYTATFLLIFYANSENATANLEYLKSLSNVDNSIETMMNKFNLFLTLPTTDTNFIPLYMLFASFSILLYYFVGDRRIELRYLLLLNLFFIIGFFIWYYNFSYDARNGLWVKVFLIVGASIVIKVIYENDYLLKYLLIIFFVILGYILVVHENPSSVYTQPTATSTNYVDLSDTSMFVVGQKVDVIKTSDGSLVTSGKISQIGINSYIYLPNAYTREATEYKVAASTIYKADQIAFLQQKKYQETIGKADIAQKIYSLVENKDECVEIITNRLPMYYNYYLKDIKKQVIANAVYVHGFLPYLKHDCKDGRYFVFGEWTKTNSGTGWELIENLIKEDKIVLIDSDFMIYFVPPQIKDNNE